MKALFLDFDGVITLPPKWILNLDKIKLIKKIVDETDAKIIVSSSWRADNIKNTIERFFNLQLEHCNSVKYSIPSLL